MTEQPRSDQHSPIVSGIVKAEHLAGELVHGAEHIVNSVAPPTERDLIRRALDLSTRKKLLLTRRLWTDPRVQAITRMPMVAGVLYVMLPIRLLPARVGPLRQFEKLVGLGVLLWLIVRMTPEEVLREHLDAVERPGLVRRMLRRE
jgi:hypothetical protein